MVRVIILGLLLVIASFSDVRTHRVSNWLILVGIGVGLCYQLVNFGLTGIMAWLQGMLVPLILLSILYVVHVLGAGDVKLFSVVGGFLGPNQVVQVIFLAFIIGAFFSIIHMIRFKILTYRLQYLANFIRNFIKDRNLVPYYVHGVDDPRAVIPFSVTICISTLILCILDMVY